MTAIQTRQSHEHYMTVRVINALLRENVRGCLNRAQVLDGISLPFAAHLAPDVRNGPWLAVPHWTDGTLYFAVCPEQYLQPWTLRGLPMLWHQTVQTLELEDGLSILQAFRAGLPDEEAAEFAAFDEEYTTAVTHRRLAEPAHRHALKSDQSEPNSWGDRTLRYDCLGAFLDHPVYPTARAKVGFEDADLQAYAPEFAPTFELCWLAVPREQFHTLGKARPTVWPSFDDVGLDHDLAETHALLPIHPFLWNSGFQGRLDDADLLGQVIQAPRTFLAVRPTLSVRTVALIDEPDWHLKLPLPISTLGLKNRRLVHPGTLGDGALVQTLLAAILKREGLTEQVLLTDESAGGHAGEPFLAFLLRQYPREAQQGTLVTVAALLAPAPGGGTVLDELIQVHYGGEFTTFWSEYVDLTLRLHLTLWLRYGVTLESNQQNTALVFTPTGLRLLLKDNDSPRVLRSRLAAALPTKVAWLNALDDRRIFVEQPQALAQMFITITLHLNLAALIHGLGQPELYHDLRERIERTLTQTHLDRHEVDEYVLNPASLPVKYMLTAGSLQSKARSGAADVNKFYGLTGPNYLR